MQVIMLPSLLHYARLRQPDHRLTFTADRVYRTTLNLQTSMHLHNIHPYWTPRMMKSEQIHQKVPAESRFTAMDPQYKILLTSSRTVHTLYSLHSALSWRNSVVMVSRHIL